ncbi:uncharacterized protein [Pagrus major]|uniref:uncharacterized protein n=1 Tax=Pagrus major TaxID=143350 RepID=UPI003CC87F54
MKYQWAEDDFDVPPDVTRLGPSVPIDGNRYVMYHGTTRQSAQSILKTGFRQSADGMLGRGVYLSRDLQKASRYPIDHPEFDKVVIKVLVNVGKVKIINHKHHPYQKTWHDHGYDTAWVPPNCGMTKSGLEEDCVWDPNRIKIIDVPPGVGQLGLSAPRDGNRYVMYYGTTKQNAEAILKTGFQQSADGMLGRGVYLSRDLQKAKRYPIQHLESDRAVIKVLVSVGRVIAIGYQGHPYQKTWHDHGYDTAWVPPSCRMLRSSLEEDCVWDPKRIQITKIINARPVQRSSGYGAYGYK